MPTGRCWHSSASDVIADAAANCEISGSGQLSRNECREVIRRTLALVARNGFHLREKKTRITPPGARKVVLGVTVTESAIKLSREVKARLPSQLYCASKFGIGPRARFRGFTSAVGFVQHMRGLLAYAQDIDPEFATPIVAQWREIEARNLTRRGDRDVGRRRPEFAAEGHRYREKSGRP